MLLVVLISGDSRISWQFDSGLTGFNAEISDPITVITDHTQKTSEVPCHSDTRRRVSVGSLA